MSLQMQVTPGMKQLLARDVCPSASRSLTCSARAGLHGGTVRRARRMRLDELVVLSAHGPSDEALSAGSSGAAARSC